MKQLKFDLTFKHKKTGKLYDASSQLVIDCTNERPDDKQICIVYESEGKIIVREAVEFLQKFELVRKIGSGGSVVGDMIHEPVELGFKVKKEEPTIDPV